MSTKTVIVCDDCGKEIQDDVCALIQIKGCHTKDYISNPSYIIYNGHICQSCIKRYVSISPNGIFQKIIHIKEDSK